MPCDAKVCKSVATAGLLCIAPASEQPSLLHRQSYIIEIAAKRIDVSDLQAIAKELADAATNASNHTDVSLPSGIVGSWEVSVRMGLIDVNADSAEELVELVPATPAPSGSTLFSRMTDAVVASPQVLLPRTACYPAHRT